MSKIHMKIRVSSREELNEILIFAFESQKIVLTETKSNLIMKAQDPNLI